jgi:hypothetical protein
LRTHSIEYPLLQHLLTKGEYPLGQLYMSVTFDASDNYRTEFLRFDVARFDCGYNAIIRRSGLVKFMAIPHYLYMILKMSIPQWIIIVRADFQGAECFQGAYKRLSWPDPWWHSLHGSTTS